ncbi:MULTISPECIES: LysR substrate-binding domain-containing protein [Salipiger]|uniref:Probable transcription regulator protein n=1 Tax=Salipiger bermudensis (strain DSM 26914 / JCM 13377 / KCTC 12554 / HTCC2601) TaxID=314265 RepID=Q0FL67_SALBH|nr:LysR substrate-binding domain-containing protein [Salipiger bermudensis]EAU44898.1 probable transcription regulator protein [Salipiger bermudensis HTCC2601]MBN9677312.1 LysR family transcriptional regulator [Salipiger bermudensis]MBR9893053.1 LysR family transcriptional regulator [bacterium]MCA1287630.1 LysR family transcriptional regulator [Salipiger bermudensis]
MRKAYIPSVAELEAFTACARRGTTTMAADSLGLTQSAISRSLASLEDRLGVALFNRVRQRLVLSPAGHAFLDRAEELLAELDAAAMGVMAFGGRDAVLRMAVLPSFARIWLIPRLARFAQVAPEISLDLSARLLPVDFGREPFDLAIMRSRHDMPGVSTEPVIPETMVIVAAPTLLAGQDALSDADLLELPLLQQSTRPTLWLDWFRGSDTDPRRILRGARLDHFDMIVDAAIAGLGVGIVPEIVARPALERGALALAAPRRFETGEHYALILPEPALASPHVQRFRGWLLDEIRR